MKYNKFLIIYLCIISLIGIISLILLYITKESKLYLGISISLVLLTYIIIYYLGWNKKIKTFQFLLGDFTFNNDVDIKKWIYTKSWPQNEYKDYLIISTYISIPLVYLANNTPITTLVIIVLSLLSIGVAFTVLSFNYTNTLNSMDEAPEEKKNLMFLSARRFFVGAIYSFFLLIFLVFLRILTPLPTEITQEPIQFIRIFLTYILNSICGVFFAILFAMSFKNYLEGLILSLRVNIKFK